MRDPILAIDTSTALCSVAVRDLEGNVWEKQGNTSSSHNEEISSVVEEVLSLSRLSAADLKGIFIGSGPGSFTGLRIGYSFVIGFGAPLEIPVVQISSFAAAAVQFVEEIPLQIVISNAGRREFYFSVFSRDEQDPSKNPLSYLLRPKVCSHQQVLDEVGEIESRLELSSEQMGLVCMDEMMSFESQYAKFTAGSLAVGLLSLENWGEVESCPLIEDASWLSSMQRLEPEYVREVYAKTIRQREVDKKASIE